MNILPMSAYRTIEEALALFDRQLDSFIEVLDTPSINQPTSIAFRQYQLMALLELEHELITEIVECEEYGFALYDYAVLYSKKDRLTECKPFLDFKLLDHEDKKRVRMVLGEYEEEIFSEKNKSFTPFVKKCCDVLLGMDASQLSKEVSCVASRIFDHLEEVIDTFPLDHDPEVINFDYQLYRDDDWVREERRLKEKIDKTWESREKRIHELLVEVREKLNNTQLGEALNMSIDDKSRGESDCIFRIFSGLMIDAKVAESGITVDEISEFFRLFLSMYMLEKMEKGEEVVYPEELIWTGTLPEGIDPDEVVYDPWFDHPTNLDELTAHIDTDKLKQQALDEYCRIIDEFDPNQTLGWDKEQLKGIIRKVFSTKGGKGAEKVVLDEIWRRVLHDDDESRYIFIPLADGKTTISIAPLLYLLGYYQSLRPNECTIANIKKLVKQYFSFDKDQIDKVNDRLNSGKIRRSWSGIRFYDRIDDAIAK